MASESKLSNVYVACVPHTPLVGLQEVHKDTSPGFWAAYDKRVAEFDAFDPELVIVFGSDHYSNIRLGLMPSFLIGHRAEAIDDSGGLPGELDVPTDLTLALSQRLIDQGFDIATSYAMKVDHGFSNVLHFFLHGKIDARPVVPVFINALAEPRPTMRRCREIGEAIGAWAATLNKRVAILGSGGLSHETGGFFPQYHNAPDERVRNFIVHGDTEGGITEQSWQDNISKAMVIANERMITGTSTRPSSVKRDWDERFLELLASDLRGLDRWSDAEILRDGGQGGSEIRLWLAAVAAGKAAGGKPVVIDYYGDDTAIGVGAGVVHAPAA